MGSASHAVIWEARPASPGVPIREQGCWLWAPTGAGGGSLAWLLPSIRMRPGPQDRKPGKLGAVPQLLLHPQGPRASPPHAGFSVAPPMGRWAPRLRWKVSSPNGGPVPDGAGNGLLPGHLDADGE